MFLVLAHVHSQHDLFDAAGVIIKNKLGAFAFEALSPGRHGGWWRRGGDRWFRCWRLWSRCGRSLSDRGRRRRHVFRYIPLPGEESDDGDDDGDPGCAVHLVRKGLELRGNRVVSTTAPGLASSEAAESQEATAPGSMGAEGFYTIVRTRGLEPAATAWAADHLQEWRERELVTAHECDKQVFH